MFRLSLIPSGTKIPFIKWRNFAFVFSFLMGLGSLALFFFHGLNYGIDFRGGTLIEIATDGPADLAEIRSELGALGLGDVSIQRFGAPNDVLIRVEQRDEINGDQALVEQIRATLLQNVDPNIEFRRAEFVGPQVSDDLKRQGFLAVTFAVIAVVIYIWLRFEWQFGVGAVAALVHDVLLTIGFFSLTGLEFNLSVIAALLTIVGYSLNDTVVIFDRIRENLRRYKKMEISDLLDLSVNETLGRTVVTAVTTLLALISLSVFGGPIIRAFSIAMIWGVVIGTYSSIYIGSPILMLLNVRRNSSDEEEEEKGASAKGA